MISTTLSVRNTLSVSCLMLSLALAGGCADSPTSPAPVFSQTDVRAGSGAPAVAGNKVSVYYTGWLYDPTKPDNKGLQFETNVGKETPFSFIVGSGNVIAGWDQGIVNQRVGGLRRLTIPQSLAYGSTRSGPIPAYATLVFEIELIAIETP